MSLFEDSSHLSSTFFRLNTVPSTIPISHRVLPHRLHTYHGPEEWKKNTAAQQLNAHSGIPAPPLTEFSFPQPANLIGRITWSASNSMFATPAPVLYTLLSLLTGSSLTTQQCCGDCLRSLMRHPLAGTAYTARMHKHILSFSIADTFPRPFSLGLTILHLLPTEALMAFVPGLLFKNTCALNSSEEGERYTPVRHQPPPPPVVRAQRTRVRKCWCFSCFCC